MKMKIVSLCASALFLTTLSLQAQKSEIRDEQSGVTIRAGVNQANVSVTESGRVDDASTLTSFQVGITADGKIGGPVYFQSGLIFTGKGSKIQEGDPATSSTWYRQTSNPFYVEVPANLLLKAPIGKSARLVVGGGPYISMGVAGKNRTEGSYLGVKYNNEDEIRFSNDDPTTLDREEGTGFGVLRRFDYGLNATAGIEGKSAILSVGYGYGLAKLQSGSNSNADDANKHRIWNLTIGIRL